MNAANLGHESRSDQARVVAVSTAALCAALLISSALAALIDTRTLNGVNVWLKPLKFQFSFALHWVTIAWLLTRLENSKLVLGSTLWPLRIGGFAAVIEVLYIALQAARGRHSHFNFETSLETILYYALMGGAAVIMMAATAWVGLLVWRHPADHRNTGFQLGAVLGLLAGSVITLIVTAPLASGALAGPGHWVGGVRNDIAGLPLFGWSTTGGDLRVPHFFAAHLLQALPVFGWLADRIFTKTSRAWVWGAFLFGIVMIVATMLQAIQGKPFLS
jgi:hypothetical protein